MKPILVEGGFLTFSCRRDGYPRRPGAAEMDQEEDREVILLQRFKAQYVRKLIN
jgi:hypothetical protein